MHFISRMSLLPITCSSTERASSVLEKSSPQNRQDRKSEILSHVHLPFTSTLTCMQNPEQHLTWYWTSHGWFCNSVSSSAILKSNSLCKHFALEVLWQRDNTQSAASLPLQCRKSHQHRVTGHLWTLAINCGISLSSWTSSSLPWIFFQ